MPTSFALTLDSLHGSLVLVAGETIGAELSLLIDRLLPIPLRPDYLRLVAGEHVPKPRRLKVQAAIAAVIGREDLLEDATVEDVQDEQEDTDPLPQRLSQLAEVA